MELQYVMSGPNYLFSTISDRTTEFLERFKKIFPEFSILYNGYTEKRIGNSLMKPVVPENIKIFVDSGGLQMNTLGHTETDELKMKVYMQQAKYGDYGFCFDTVPITIFGKGKKVVQTSRLKECWLKTIENIKTQARYFKESGTKCKIIPILQAMTAHQGVEVFNMFQEHLHDYIDVIHGYAVGSMLTPSQSKYACYYIPTMFKHLGIENGHLLGVSGRDIIRVYQISQPCKKMLSFDSTSESSSFCFGREIQNEPTLIEDFRQFFTEMGLTDYANDEKFLQDMYDAYYVHKSSYPKLRSIHDEQRCYEIIQLWVLFNIWINYSRIIKQGEDIKQGKIELTTIEKDFLQVNGDLKLFYEFVAEHRAILFNTKFAEGNITIDNNVDDFF